METVLDQQVNRHTSRTSTAKNPACIVPAGCCTALLTGSHKLTDCQRDCTGQRVRIVQVIVSPINYGIVDAFRIAGVGVQGEKHITALGCCAASVYVHRCVDSCPRGCDFKAALLKRRLEFEVQFPNYERWAKIFNLKEAAKTLNFLMENGLTNYDELALRAEQAEDGFNAASQKIKQLEARMAGVAQLKTHIIQYSKTREVYAAYTKSRHKKEFLAEHGAEITQHEAAKKAFDALGGKAIPKVAQLSAEYAALLEEKREQYEQYKALRQDMVTYQTALRNVDKILGLEPPEQAQEKEQKKPER